MFFHVVVTLLTFVVLVILVDRTEKRSQAGEQISTLLFVLCLVAVLGGSMITRVLDMIFGS